MRCAGLGLTLCATLALGAYGGYRLDSWLHTEPFLLITGCLVGLAAGMIYVVRTVNALQSGGPHDEAP